MAEAKRTLRALSIRQPWADLILTGQKDIEIRVWKAVPRIPYPERIWLHASKTLDTEAYYALRDFFGDLDLLPNPYDYERGGLVGQVDITNILSYGSAMQFQADENRHRNIGLPIEPEEFRIIPGQNRVVGIEMKNPEKLENPIRYSGKLGLFEVKI